MRGKYFTADFIMIDFIIIIIPINIPIKDADGSQYTFLLLSALDKYSRNMLNNIWCAFFLICISFAKISLCQDEVLNKTVRYDQCRLNSTKYKI